jgi:hypothetical protein
MVCPEEPPPKRDFAPVRSTVEAISANKDIVFSY